MNIPSLIRAVMAWKYKYFLKPILFLFDPEHVHDFFTVTGNFLGSFALTRNVASRIFLLEHPSLHQKVFGLIFKNPVGLSAGFDKNAKLVTILPSVGFGFGEVGTITRDPYVGNPQPRLVRLPKSKSILVYYGLKNDGVDKIIPRIQKKIDSTYHQIISVGKTNCKDTADDEVGIQHYFDCLKKLEIARVGDMYELNISCPNTFGGEPFTTPDRLEKLMKKISVLKIKKPIVVKMPINLVWKDFEKLLLVLIKYKVHGVTIGNLNKDHHDLTVKDTVAPHLKGGLSGYPTWRLSNDLIAQTYLKYGKKLVIIGVGGIFTAEDAYEKIKLGASLVELITGMIFTGPQLIGQINEGIVELLKRDGYSSISQAIGSSHR